MVAISPTVTNGSHNECNPLIISHEEQEPHTHSRKNSRKQWSVQGEPRSLLKRLRSQLAEDGCPESQYLMAKALLEHSEDLNYEENCHQAIFWLTQASLQGHLEATKLLRCCLEEGLGICEQNYQDVKKCLEMDHQEKLALVAGKQLFSSLAEGNEFVTQKKLETKIYEILNTENESEIYPEEENIHKMSKVDLKTHLEEKYGSQRLSESLMVEAALELVRGEIPSIRLKDRNSHSPLMKIHIFMLNVIEASFYHKFTLLDRLSRVFFLLFLAVAWGMLVLSFNWGQVALISLVIMWFVCFLTMCYCAISILIRKKNKPIFNIWARIFQHFSQEINLDIASVKYRSKINQYYFSYFGCMLAYLVLLPFVNSSLKAFITPPLLIISCCMLTSLVQSNLSYNCLSSFLYIFAHYSEGQKMFKFWLVDNVPSLRPYLIQDYFILYDTFYFNLDIGSVFHSLWFVSSVFVTLSIGVSGILLHTMCVTWFHMTLVAAVEGCGSWIYFSVVFWCLVCFLPEGLSLLTVTLPSLLFSTCVFVSGFGLWLTVSVFVISSISLCALSRLDSKLGSILKHVLILLSLVFLFQQHAETRSKISPLKWEQFQNTCLPPKEAIEIQTARDCRPFKGTVVQWQATVKQVQIDSVSNLPESLLSFFPAIVQPHLKCAFGNPPSPCEISQFSADADLHRCLLLRDLKGRECSLQHWDEYQFSFVVSMESHFWKFAKSADVVLLAGNEFQKAAFNLSVHDRISFVGSLHDGLGSAQPIISLTSLACLDCRIKAVSASNNLDLAIDYEMFSKSLKSTFNFLFGPTITI